MKIMKEIINNGNKLMSIIMYQCQYQRNENNGNGGGVKYRNINNENNVSIMA
jgi:hypothetical protein